MITLRCDYPSHCQGWRPLFDWTKVQGLLQIRNNAKFHVTLAAYGHCGLIYMPRQRLISLQAGQNISNLKLILPFNTIDLFEGAEKSNKELYWKVEEDWNIYYSFLIYMGRGRRMGLTANAASGPKSLLVAKEQVEFSVLEIQ